MPEKQADIHMYSDGPPVPQTIRTLQAHAAAGIGANMSPVAVRQVSEVFKVNQRLVDCQESVIAAQSEALIKLAEKYREVQRRERRILIAVAAFMAVWWTVEIVRWLT